MERKPLPVITADSTREEVLAAVAAHDAAQAETRAYLATLKFPGLDGVENPKAGCYWSEDGNVRVQYRPPRDQPPHLARQAAAGEEDQDDGEWAIG